MNKEQLKIMSLIVAIFVGLTSIVNMSVTSFVLLNDRQTASMSPNRRETLNIQVEADLGRPSPLTYLFRHVRSWWGTWYVGGSAKSQACTGLTISVTGSNIVTNATIDYYIEAEASDASGNMFRFLEGNGTQVTVGSPFEVTNQTTINNHMEAMGLSTTASHTINYYLYVEAEATGAVSGEPLTSEITKTLFDTVTYNYGTTVSVSERTPTSSWDGYVSANGAYGKTQTSMYMGDYDASSYDYSIWVGFPDVSVEQGVEITGAYLKLYASSQNGGQPTMRISAIDEHSALPPTSNADYWSRPRTTAYRNWPLPAWQPDGWRQSYNIGEVIQEIVNRGDWDAEENLCLLLEDSESGYDDQDRCAAYQEDFGSTQAPELIIYYLDYSASWYDIPPLSVVDMPITFEVGAVLVTFVVAAYILTDIKRRKND